jgi:hypothetical protein
MIDFKLLRGELKQTIIHGDYSMTLEVLDDGLLFVEVKHSFYVSNTLILGNVVSRRSVIVKFNYRFYQIVEYAKTILEKISRTDLFLNEILSNIIFMMRYV